MELSFEIRELTECIVGTLLIEAVKKLTYLEHEEIAILYAKGFQWETTIKELFALESVMQEVDALLREFSFQRIRLQVH